MQMTWWNQYNSLTALTDQDCWPCMEAWLDSVNFVASKLCMYVYSFSEMKCAYAVPPRILARGLLKKYWRNTEMDTLLYKTEKYYQIVWLSEWEMGGPDIRS